MAHVQRVIVSVFVALLLVMTWTQARATITPTTATYYYFVANASSQAPKYASLAALIATVSTWFPGAGAGAYCTMSGSFCDIKTSTGTYWGASNTASSTASTCPANSTLTGGNCVCNAPTYLEQGGSCVLQQAIWDASCKANADSLNFVGAPLIHYGAVGLSACFGGFSVTGSGAASGGGQTELYGPFKCAGTSASVCSVVPKPSTIVVDCPTGQYPGTVNGVQVCSPPANTIEAPKTTTAIPPTPGASAPQIPNAPAGSTVEEEQTVCTGSSCTTTTTYKNAGGTVTGSKTEEESKANHCAENPKAPGCEEFKSSFSGDCAAGFTFDGDAIQGAIAKEVYRQNCLINQATDESALYIAEKAKTGDQSGTLPGNQTVTVGPGSFDSSDAIGGAACITDKTVTVWGKSIVLPFSTVCPAMGYLKAILLAVSYLTAAGIVIGRKT